MENNLDHIIDKKIQEAMGNFEVPYQPSHWAKMQDKMTQMEAQETQLDDSLRNRLSNIEQKFEPTHWAAMASQLDNLDAEDTDFDDTIRERVERVEAPYSPSHWEIMNKQLDEHFTLKGKIVRYKIIEVSLMLLALFTAYNVFDTEGPSSEKGIEIPLIKTEQNIQPSKAAEPKTFNKGYDWRKQNNNQNSKKQDANKPIVSTQTIDNLPTGQAGQYVANNISNNSTINTATDLVQNQAQNETPYNKESAQGQVETINPIVSTNETNVEGSENGKNGKNGKNTEGPLTTISTQDAVAALSTKALVDLNVVSEMPLAALDLNVINGKKGIDEAEQIHVLRPKALSIQDMYASLEMPKPKKNQWWRFGIFGTSSSDIALTDYTFNDVLKGATNIATGNKGLGFSVGFKKGRIELESGLSYKHKEYEPADFELKTGTIANYTRVVTPELIKLNILTIPLNLNYSFIDSKHFNFYTALGASTNFATGINAIYPADYDGNKASQNIVQANQDLRKKEGEVDVATYSKGMFNDFKFKENYYFTAQAALGLEYKMSPFTSLFLQTGYEQHVFQAGIGSRNDRISSFNLQAGAKVSFGKTKF
jgi:hypothetical protein